MYYNKVEICGVNTAKLPTLTSQEKKALLLQVKEGNMAAREKLIDGNLRLVLSIVQRFTNRRENLDDLFQVGCIGLIKAVDHFNTEIDVEFSTYAVPMAFVCRERNRKKSTGKRDTECREKGEIRYACIFLFYIVCKRQRKSRYCIRWCMPRKRQSTESD